MSEEAEILALAAQRVGTVLHGKYHLDGVLGVGGMATVYAATHRNRKRFAVKMLHPEFSVRRELRARFIREGYVANSVAHPGVVAVLDDDVDETGSAFLVMELLEGSTVDALAPIPLREALGITCQLLEVLEAAHQKSVVHRDIKPSNLFILRDGQLKVLDFGIARLRDADTGLKSTRTGATLGTPAFMAPEQARAMPDAIDARTDIWGVGATLFTVLTARFVHEGDNARQIMINAATEPARSIESLLPELPATVAAIVARALEFESSQRWPSAAVMREAVLEAYRALFGAEPVRADIAELVARTSANVASQPTERAAVVDLPSLQTTASTPLTTRPPAHPKKAYWGSAALILAGLLLVLGAAWKLRQPDRIDLPAASAPPAASSPPSSTSALASPPSVEPVPSAVVSTSASVAPSTRPIKRVGPLVSRTAALAASAPTTTAATVAASRPPAANPLQLELQ